MRTEIRLRFLQQLFLRCETLHQDQTNKKEMISQKQFIASPNLFFIKFTKLISDQSLSYDSSSRITFRPSFRTQIPPLAAFTASFLLQIFVPSKLVYSSPVSPNQAYYQSRIITLVIDWLDLAMFSLSTKLMIKKSVLSRLFLLSSKCLLTCSQMCIGTSKQSMFENSISYQIMSSFLRQLSIIIPFTFALKLIKPAQSQQQTKGRMPAMQPPKTPTPKRLPYLTTFISDLDLLSGYFLAKCLASLGKLLSMKQVQTPVQATAHQTDPMGAFMWSRKASISSSFMLGRYSLVRIPDSWIFFISGCFCFLIMAHFFSISLNLQYFSIMETALGLAWDKSWLILELSVFLHFQFLQLKFHKSKFGFFFMKKQNYQHTKIPLLSISFNMQDKLLSEDLDFQQRPQDPNDLNKRDLFVPEPQYSFSSEKLVSHKKANTEDDSYDIKPSRQPEILALESSSNLITDQDTPIESKTLPFPTTDSFQTGLIEQIEQQRNPKKNRSRNPTFNTKEEYLEYVAKLRGKKRKDSGVTREVIGKLTRQFSESQLEYGLWTQDLEQEPEDIALTMSMNQRLVETREKGWIGRIFRPMSQGSLRSSVFTIFSGSVGAGVLSIPKIYSYFGLTAAIIITILNAFFAYTSYNALFNSILMVKKKRFSNLVNTILGKVPAQMFAITIILSQFVGIMVFVCIMWSLVQHILIDYNLIDLNYNRDTQEVYPYDNKTFIVRTIGISIMMLVIYPFTTLRKLNAMRYLSLANLIILMYTVTLIVFQSFAFIKQNHSTGARLYNIEYLAQGVTMNTFSGMTTMVLSYMCHPNFVYVRSEMVAPTQKRVRKSIRIALIIECLTYILIGTAGYLSTGDNLTPNLFIMRKGLVGTTDYLMKMSTFMFLFVCVTGIILNIFPCREQTYAYFQIDSSSNKVHFGITFLIMFLSHLIVILFPNIMSLFGISGSIFCSIIGWIVPYLMQIVLLKNKRWYQYPKCFYYLGFYFMVFLALIGSVQSVFRFKF